MLAKLLVVYYFVSFRNNTEDQFLNDAKSERNRLEAELSQQYLSTSWDHTTTHGYQGWKAASGKDEENADNNQYYNEYQGWNTTMGGYQGWNNSAEDNDYDDDNNQPFYDYNYCPAEEYQHHENGLPSLTRIDEDGRDSWYDQEFWNSQPYDGNQEKSHAANQNNHETAIAENV